MFLDRKFIKNKRISVILLVLILSFFIKLTDFPKNIYNLINNNYDERFSKSYNDVYFSGYCKKSAHGYINYIKKKFSKIFPLNSVPKIINLDPVKRKKPYWIFLKHDPKINDNFIILLNYNKNLNSFATNEYEILDNHNNNCMFLMKND